MGCTNSPIGYANPDAVTQIANGLSTTTFAYDNDGNVTQKTVDGTTTTYVWDYANRLIALGAGGATTTYGYDGLGQRVIQTGTSTTYLYPFNWYSVASSTGAGAKYATTTDYVFGGDTLLATVDQQTAIGVATGTAKTRYVHADHLGSTNVVTDENDNVVQTLDYYLYGGTRISTNSGTNEKRKYIGQFSDDSGLSYLNARYMDPSRGQFTSEEPVELAIGDPNQLQQIIGQSQQQLLADPQKLNYYGYGRDNPTTQKDPNGKFSRIFAGAVIGDVVAIGTQLYSDISTGQTSGVSTYVAVGLGGAANGAYLAATDGRAGVFGALSQGGLQSSISQAANYLNGSSNTFSLSQVGVDALSNAPYGLIPGLQVKGVTYGRNSFEAIGKSIFTKYDNAYISRIGLQTAGKIAVSNIVKDAPSNAAQTIVTSAGGPQSLIANLTSFAFGLQSFLNSYSTQKKSQ
jgi:RHS repeat-associated protein